MKTFVLASLAVVSLATPAIAREKAREITFARDGVTYIYTQTRAGERTLINGQSFPSGGHFDLVVYNGRVSGTSNGFPVAFAVSDTVLRAPEIAAR